MRYRILCSMTALSVLTTSLEAQANCPSQEEFETTVEQFIQLNNRFGSAFCQPLKEAALQHVPALRDSTQFKENACIYSNDIPMEARDRLDSKSRIAMDELRGVYEPITDLLKVCVLPYYEGCVDYNVCTSYIARLSESNILHHNIRYSQPFGGPSTPKNLMAYLNKVLDEKERQTAPLFSQLRREGFPELCPAQPPQIIEKIVVQEIPVEKIVVKEVPAAPHSCGYATDQAMTQKSDNLPHPHFSTLGGRLHFYSISDTGYPYEVFPSPHQDNAFLGTFTSKSKSHASALSLIAAAATSDVKQAAHKTRDIAGFVNLVGEGVRFDFEERHIRQAYAALNPDSKRVIDGFSAIGGQGSILVRDEIIDSLVRNPLKRVFYNVVGNIKNGLSLAVAKPVQALANVGVGAGKILLPIIAEPYVAYGINHLGLSPACSSVVAHQLTNGVAAMAMGGPISYSIDNLVYLYTGWEDIKECIRPTQMVQYKPK